MSDRYLNMFSKLKEHNEGAFIPFVTLGDPDIPTSLEIIRTLIRSGADALELGFPFSDPIADGPVIQRASLRALDSGVTPDDCFEMIRHIRDENEELPIGLLLYANLIVARGVERFYADAAAAGVDSILAADVPIRESALILEAARKHHIAAVFIAAPGARESVLEKIAARGRGYTYLLSRAGVTGTESRAHTPAAGMIRKLEALKAPPPVLGFGVSEKNHVRAALAAGARGVFVGSAVVKRIETNLENHKHMLKELEKYARGMKAATRGTTAS